MLDAGLAFRLNKPKVPLAHPNNKLLAPQISMLKPMPRHLIAGIDNMFPGDAWFRVRRGEAHAFVIYHDYILICTCCPEKSSKKSNWWCMYKASIPTDSYTTKTNRSAKEELKCYTQKGVGNKGKPHHK